MQTNPNPPELREKIARACFAAHHSMGPTEEAYGEPNWGRATDEKPSGFKTERAVWDAVARAAISIIDNETKEPVAWRWRYRREGAHWTVCQTPRVSYAASEHDVGVEVEPLYAAPQATRSDEALIRLARMLYEATYPQGSWIDTTEKTRARYCQRVAAALNPPGAE